MPIFNLKKFRLTQTTLTQAEFALKISCSRSTISNIEVGMQKMSDRILNQIALAFEIEVEPYKSYAQQEELKEKENAPPQNAAYDFEEMQQKYLKNLEEKNLLLEKYNQLLEKLGRVYESKSELQTKILEYEKQLQKCSKS